MKLVDRLVDHVSSGAQKGVTIGDNGGKVKNLRHYTATINFASLLDGASGGADVTATGVVLANGDVCIGVQPIIDAGDDYFFAGQVTADDTVRVTAFNRSGGTVDLASTTFHIWVLQLQT